MSPLKIGIVGTGKVTVASYLPYLAQEPDVTLGYYSRTREKSDACAAQFECCQVRQARQLLQPVVRRASVKKI